MIVNESLITKINKDTKMSTIMMLPRIRLLIIIPICKYTQNVLLLKKKINEIRLKSSFQAGLLSQSYIYFYFVDVSQIEHYNTTL